MNLLGIVQSYVSLTESLAKNLIAKNIASSVADTNPTTNTTVAGQSSKAEASASSPTGRGAVTSDKAILPDASQQQAETHNASLSLLGLRTPNAANNVTAGLLGELIASFANAENDSLLSDADALAANNDKGSAPANGGQTANEIRSKFLLSRLLADQVARLNETIAAEQSTESGQEASPRSSPQLQQPSPQTMAALLRNIVGQTGSLHGHGMPDDQTATIDEMEEARQEAESTSATGQYADPRSPADKRIGTTFIPPQNASASQGADQDRRNHLSDAVDVSAQQSRTSETNSPTDKKPLAHASGMVASQEQSQLEQALNHNRLKHPGEALLNSLNNGQLTGPMYGMDAAILNAAMIPGWPAPRPFAMPKQIPPGQLKQTKATGTDQASETGTSSQQKTKDSQGRNEAAIQNYLLNMGLKKSLLNKLRNALRPAKQRVKVMFGLAVLVTQAIFTLHTVLEELNNIEEDEDKMMHDPKEQKRRLQG